MRRLGKGCIAALVALAAAAMATAFGAPLAYADQTIYAVPSTQYLGGDISISQGEKVTFTNLDTVSHDVTAKLAGTDGKPLFGSAYTNPAGSQPVAGTEYLTTGSYQYFCSIHPFMTGTITVTGAGTPVPRPGGGGSGSGSGAASGPGSGSSAPSGTAASVHLKVLDTKLATVRKRGSLRVSVSADRAATIGLEARSGKTLLASGSAALSQAGTRNASLKLTAAGRKLVRRSHSLTVSVSARGTGSSAGAATAAATSTLH